MQPDSRIFFVCFVMDLTGGGYIKFLASPPLICLLELYVCLSISGSFIYPSIPPALPLGIKTIHHVPKASCHSDCCTENNQSQSSFSVQREGQQWLDSLSTTPSADLNVVCCITLHPIETTAPVLFLSLGLSSSPSLVSPFPSSRVGDLIGGVCWSVEFHLTCLLLILETMAHSPPPSQLPANLQGNWNYTMQLVQHTMHSLSSFFFLNRSSYLLSSTLSFCSLLSLLTCKLCAMFTTCCNLSTSLFLSSVFL